MTGLTAIVVAFYYSWKLTLLVLAFVPFIALFGAVQTSLNTSFAASAQKKLSEAGAVSYQTISLFHFFYARKFYCIEIEINFSLNILRYVTLCYVMLRCVTLCYVVLRYVSLQPIIF